MADDLTEEDIEAKEELIALQIEQARTGKKSNEEAIKLYLNTTKTGKALSGLGNATTDVTSGFIASTKAMASSTGDFGNLSGAVSGTVNAVTGLLKSLNDASAGVPLFGGAISGLGKAAIATATFAFGEVQKGFTSFQELSKAGLIGAEGISGMAKEMRAANLPLATYTKLLQSNSQDLSFLSTSALEGGKTFSKVMTDMAGDTGQPLRRLGLSIDEIGETVVDFQKMQRRQGMLDTLSQAEIRKGTVEYAKELDLIAKLTGKSREGIQKERDAAMSDSRFRASIAEMEPEIQRKHMDALSQISDPTLKRAYMDQLSGFTNSTASITSEISGMGNSIRGAIKLINEGQGNSSEAVNMMREQARLVTESGSMLQQYSKVVESGSGVMINFATISDFANETLKSQKEAAEAQKKLSAAAGSQTDKLATAMKAMQTSASRLNNFFIATPQATTAILKFSTIIDTASSKLESVALGDKGLGDVINDVASKAVDKVVDSALDANQAFGQGVIDAVKSGFNSLLVKDNVIRHGPNPNYRPPANNRTGSHTSTSVPDPDGSVMATPLAGPVPVSSPAKVNMANLIAEKTKEKDRLQSAVIADMEAVNGQTLTPERQAESRELVALMRKVTAELAKLNDTATAQKKLQQTGNKLIANG